MADRRPGAPGPRAAGRGDDAARGSEARGVPAGGAAVAGRRYRRAGHRSGHAGPRLASVFAGFSQLFFDFVRGDVPAVRRRAADMAAECRDAGIASLLAYALVYLANAQLLRGEFLDAIATAEEGLRIAADTGQTAVTGELASTAARLAAITGDEEACRARAAQVRDLSARAQTLALAGADCALAMLDLGSGRYQSALDRMQAATARPGPAQPRPAVRLSRPCRGGGPGRPDRSRGPAAGPVHRLGRRHRPAVGHRGSCAVRRADRGRRRRRASVPAGGRRPRGRRPPVRAGAHPAAVRRVAAPQPAPRRRPRAPARRGGRLRADGRPALAGPRRGRAARRRRRRRRP